MQAPITVSEPSANWVSFSLPRDTSGIRSLQRRVAAQSRPPRLSRLHASIGIGPSRTGPDHRKAGSRKGRIGAGVAAAAALDLVAPLSGLATRARHTTQGQHWGARSE